MGDIAITVTHVTKAYRSRVALDDVTWVAEARRVHGIVGANGSGKTTLLKVLAGLTVFDSGRAQVLDTVLEPGRHRVASGIGIPWRTCPCCRN